MRSMQMRKEMQRVHELSINKVSIQMPSVQKPLVLMLLILMGTAPMLHDSNAACFNASMPMQTIPMPPDLMQN